MTTALVVLRCYVTIGAVFAVLWAMWEGLPRTFSRKQFPWFVEALCAAGLAWPLVLYVIAESHVRGRR